MLTRGVIATAIVLATFGCNQLSGLSSLEKVDCAAGGCGANGAGGEASGGGAQGGNGSGGGSTLEQPVGLSTGRHGSCVMSMNDGLARCWGSMPGNGTDISLRPVIIPDIQAVEAGHGYAHHCLRDATGDLHCWGNNDFGQLGDGTNVSKLVPTKVAGLSGVTKVSCGAFHTCAETDTERYCWGNNAYGQLGVGDTVDRYVPTVIPLPPTTHFGTGAFHGCAVLDTPEVMCWGRNDQGQVGVDPAMTPLALSPVLVPGLPAAERAYPGVRTTCIRTTNVRELHCWGNNDFGQLGDGSTVSSLTAVHVSAITRLGVLYPGLRHTCATDTSDSNNVKAYCWGANDFGQLGLTMDTPMFLVPQQIAENISGDMGAKTSEHTCYIDGAGQVLCAGLNDTGQLGDGTTTTRDVFMPVLF